MPVTLVEFESAGMRTKLIIAPLVLALSGWAHALVPFALQGARLGAPVETAHSHSCCPKLHGSHLHRSVVPAVPASLPCGDRHSCCFERDSSHPVTLTTSSRVERADSRIASFDSNEAGAQRSLALTRNSATPHAPSELSTILRN